MLPWKQVTSKRIDTENEALAGKWTCLGLVPTVALIKSLTTQETLLCVCVFVFLKKIELFSMKDMDVVPEIVSGNNFNFPPRTIC